LLEFGLDAHNGTVFSPEEAESVVTVTPSGLVSPTTRDSHDLSNGDEYLSEEGNSAMDEECCYSSEQGELLNEVCASTTASVSGVSRKPKRNAIGATSSVPKKRLPKVYMVSPIVDRNPVANCPELSNHVCDRCEPKISFAGKAEFLSHCEKEHNLEIHKVRTMAQQEIHIWSTIRYVASFSVPNARRCSRLLWDFDNTTIATATQFSCALSVDSRPNLAAI